MAEIDALAAPVIFGRGHGDIGRPPVPAQLVHRPRVARAGLAQRDGRHRELVCRIGRIARQSGNAGHPVVLGKVRFKRPIIDWPVIRRPVQRPHAKVGRVHARVMGGEEDCAAANPVEVGNLHQRVVVVDGVIGFPRAAIGADVEIRVAARFPIAAVAWELAGFDPVSLLEAEDLHARFGQAPGDGGAGSAGADDQDVDHLIGGSGGVGVCLRCHNHVPGSSTSRHILGRPRTASSSDQSPCSSTRPVG